MKTLKQAAFPIALSMILTGCAGVGPKNTASVYRGGEAASLEQLNSCINTKAVLGGAGGGVGAAILCKLTMKGASDAQIAACALAGAAAGAYLAWRNAYGSCSKELNLVAASSVQTQDFSATAQRYSYNGQGTLLQIEAVNLPNGNIVSGQKIPAGIRYVLLTPNAQEAALNVQRHMFCNNKDGKRELIFSNIDPYTEKAGTNQRDGFVQTAPLPRDVGPIQCEMVVEVFANGQRQEARSSFALVPGGA